MLKYLLLALISSSANAGTFPSPVYTCPGTLAANVCIPPSYNGLTFPDGTVQISASLDTVAVTTVGAFGSNSPVANAAVITDHDISFQPATATFPGMVDTLAQIWSGAKQFNAAPILFSLSASSPLALDTQKHIISPSYATFTSSLSNFTGDAGSGGVKGLVPAPATGDATKFLRGDATWANPTVLTVGTIDGQTASANGAVITAGSIFLQSASATVPGLVNLTTQTLKGNKTFQDNAGLASVNIGSRILVSTGGKSTVAYESSLLNDNTTGASSVDWTNRFLVSAEGHNTVAYEAAFLNDNATGATSLDWGNRIAINQAGKTVIDWQNRSINLGTGLNPAVVNFGGQVLGDSNGFQSLNWANRTANDTSGNPIVYWGGDQNLASIGNIDTVQLYVQGNATQTSNIFEIRNNSAAELVSVDSSGNMNVIGPTIHYPNAATGTGTALALDASGNIILQPSSKRFKKDISSLKFDSKKILALAPVKYKYKHSQEEDIGLIAEDVHKFVPALVNYDSEKRPFSVKYDRLSLALLQLVKDQEKRLSSLERKLNAKD